MEVSISPDELWQETVRSDSWPQQAASARWLPPSNLTTWFLVWAWWKYVYIYTYYVLLCTVLHIDDVGTNLWDKDILEPLTPVSPGSERERPSHHQPRPASKSQCLWSSHGQVQLGAGTMACGSTSLCTRCYHNMTIIWTIYICVCGSESASMNSMDKYELWLISEISININQCSFCFTLDFGGSSSGNIQVSQKRLHAQRGRYFCKARRLELKGRSLFAQEAT